MNTFRSASIGLLVAVSLMSVPQLHSQSRAAQTFSGRVFLADQPAGGHAGTSITATGEFGPVPSTIGLLGCLILLAAAVGLRRRSALLLLLASGSVAVAALDVTSAGSGAFVLSPDGGGDFQPGRWRLRFTHEGYHPEVRVVRILGDEPSQVDLPDVTLHPLVPPCTVFPANNPWNTDISGYPLHPNSAAYVNFIGADDNLHPDFGTFYKGGPIGIPFIEVPGSQPKLPVGFRYDDESDVGPYPIPSNPPIEGGPEGDGDRHILMLDRDQCKLFELYRAFPPGHENNPLGGQWYADSGAIFDLRSNVLRPNTWTSADAAGLPIYPGLVRYEEVVQQGVIHHALRFTVRQTQRGFIHPATHFASDTTAANRPPMGLRFRLNGLYDCSGFSSEAQVVCTALKKYGMFVADNGSDWFLSGSHDPRWDDDRLGDLKQIPGSAFEAVDTGPILTQ